ncbi:MAG: ankyrin repeat domain-containing protein [Spirochaetales bacterium]|nr:ankyrin repeat domain-containing protein [Spirochaetales bacterium]
MNILGIYSPSLRSECVEGLAKTESLGIPHEIRDSSFFGSLSGAAVKLLEGHTHFVAAPDKDDEESLWFVQVASYALGSGKPLFLLAPLAGNSTGFFPSGDILAFFRMEKEKYLFNEMIRTSKEELASSGIAFSTEAFCESVSEGALKAVELFLRAGFSPDVKNKRGVSALSLAIRGGHRSIVSLLIKKGVDINRVSEDRGNTPLMDAAASGDEDLINILVSAGSNLDVRSKNGQTALILALGQANENAALALLKAGADPSLKDNLGMDAAKYAQLFGKHEVLEYLTGS